MGRLWWLFFLAWPVTAIGWSWVSPRYGWWFPTEALSPLGAEIDNLFYLILVIVAVVFVLTNLALVYVLWRFSGNPSERGWFSHGSHNLEVIWTITPAGVLLFISLYQMDVWARYRIQKNFPEAAVLQPIAEVTARQFEWRIRYPAPTRKFKNQQEVQDWLENRAADDVHTVNDLHVPTGRPVLIHLRTEDVLHSFFIPDLRVKQDAVPGLVIPVWFEASKSRPYELVCAELCGWGHYKMKGRVVAEPDDEYESYLHKLSASQFDDGVAAAKDEAEESEGEAQE